MQWASSCQLAQGNSLCCRGDAWFSKHLYQVSLQFAGPFFVFVKCQVSLTRVLLPEVFFPSWESRLEHLQVWQVSVEGTADSVVWGFHWQPWGLRVPWGQAWGLWKRPGREREASLISRPRLKIWIFKTPGMLWSTWYIPPPLQQSCFAALVEGQQGYHQRFAKCSLKRKMCARSFFHKFSVDMLQFCVCWTSSWKLLAQLVKPKMPLSSWKLRLWSFITRPHLRCGRVFNHESLVWLTLGQRCCRFCHLRVSSKHCILRLFTVGDPSFTYSYSQKKKQSQSLTVFFLTTFSLSSRPGTPLNLFDGVYLRTNCLLAKHRLKPIHLAFPSPNWQQQCAGQVGK